LEIAEDLNLAGARASANVPGVEVAFDVLVEGGAVFIGAQREVGLFVFLIFAGMNYAAWETSDQRRILAAFGVLRLFFFLGAQVGGKQQKGTAEQKSS